MKSLNMYNDVANTEI